jgi:hypothetical protein
MKETADSIVVRILQLPEVMITMPAKMVQGDEKLCQQYLMELYEQRHNGDTMLEVFGEELLMDIYDYCEIHILKMKKIVLNELKPRDAGPNMEPVLGLILDKVMTLEMSDKPSPHQIQKLVKEIIDANLINVPTWLKSVTKNVELVKEIESQIIFTHWMLARLSCLITKHFGNEEEEISYIIDLMEAHPNIITNFPNIKLMWND